MKAKKLTASVILLILVCTTFAIFHTQTTSASAKVLVEWYYIHCEETHDVGKGRFYIKIRWTEDSSYYYYSFPGVKLAAEENDYPGTTKLINQADYPGSIGVQLWEDDIRHDDLIIDWRNTNIPCEGCYTFSWEYESPPGGCYIRIDIWHLLN